jgi:adenine deaminase
MTLSFLSLSVIGAIKVTDQGLIHGADMKVINLFVD